MDKKKSFLVILSETRFLHILLSIILGFVVGAFFLVIMGLSVGDAYGRLLSSVTSVKGFSYVVVYAIPYIVTGLSVAFSFKTGVFNIGAEGQFVMGSMAAAVVGILLGDLPKFVLIPLCFLVAMAAGALWGVVVALLKTKGIAPGIYNVCSGQAHEIYEVIDGLLQFSLVKIKVAKDPERFRPSEVPRFVGSAKKLQEATGWRPRVPFLDGLVILAGGGGTRLFPLSRRSLPKQFLSIDDNQSLLGETILRCKGLVRAEDILIVTNQQYVQHVQSELRKTEAEGAQIVLEPTARSTADGNL